MDRDGRLMDTQPYHPSMGRITICPHSPITTVPPGWEVQGWVAILRRRATLRDMHPSLRKAFVDIAQQVENRHGVK